MQRSKAAIFVCLKQRQILRVCALRLCRLGDDSFVFIHIGQLVFLCLSYRAKVTRYLKIVFDGVKVEMALALMASAVITRLGVNFYSGAC